MACEYYSYAVFEQFTDLKTLEKALARMEFKENFTVNGLRVRATNDAEMGQLKQAYQTESAKAALKKKGFFVTETKTANGIKLTVRA